MTSRKKLAHKNAERSCYSKKDGGSELLVSLIFRKGNKLTGRKKSEQKLRCHGKVRGSIESKKLLNKSSRDKIVYGNASTKRNLISSKFFRHKKLKAVSKKLSSSRTQDGKPVLAPSDENKQNDNEDVTIKKRRRKKKKRQKHLLELDEASRLQRRTRYLIIRMKLEQNLIDAYSGEGWKGQSREKIKPTKELLRAKKQILSCKLGIRDAIRQLDSISSVGSIEDSVIAPDGSVHHEHIFCAKCKTNKTFPDNDIILCDGTCNCAFHQKCLDPPLETESIPPGDQGWFCRFCERKMEIIESINAHLGTCFPLDSNWQDIFKEEAASPDGGIQVLDLEEEWPSDDSEDDDYDPNGRTNTGISCVDTIDASSCDTSSSTSLSWSLDGELLAGAITPGKEGINYQDSVEFDESMDADTVCGRRQRSAVDYKKLYDEMFGKDTTLREQASEDEDWGPTKRRRRERETDAASTLMTLHEGEKRSPCGESSDVDKKINTESRTRRSIFRIPTTAVERLRQVFAENELPSRSVKDNLAKEFGLDPEKVSKWFKNARYMALKARKAGGRDNLCPSPQVHRDSEVAKTRKTAPLVSVDGTTETALHMSKDSEKVGLSKGSHELCAQSNEVNFEFDDDICLKQIKLLKSKTKKSKRKFDLMVNGKRRVELATGNGSQETEAKLETLCTLQSRLDSLRKRILTYQLSKSKGPDGSHFCRPSVVYVPVAELKEKA